MDNQSDIRKWFLKQPHKKDFANVPQSKLVDSEGRTVNTLPPDSKKSSKYFADKSIGHEPKQRGDESKPKIEKGSPTKRKVQIANTSTEGKSRPSPKKLRTEHNEEHAVSEGKGSGKIDIGNAVEAIMTAPSGRQDARNSTGTPKRVLSSPGKGRGRDSPIPVVEESKLSSAGKGRGGGGRGYFLHPRGPPPHKGEKALPQGAENCLAGLTFVISGTLDSLEREEAEDLIKRHGGRVTSAVSKKTSFLLAGEDVGARKSEKATDLGVPFLTEDKLFEMIHSSNSLKTASEKRGAATLAGDRGADVCKVKASGAELVSPRLAGLAERSEAKPSAQILGIRKTAKGGLLETRAWTDKYQPRSSAEITGNQSIVKQLHDWLDHWDDQHLHSDKKVKRRGGGGSSSTVAAKKAVLLSGSPGIGKTTSARLVSKELGFEALEVNASDSRGKADSKVGKGIGGSLANAIKEMVSNESLAMSDMDWRINHQKSVLIMDEVDGMSGGDRGGVADLIASIKTSKIPIICICNDRYSQKLKSLVNYCLPLNFRKPTKQQMAKRLQQVAQAEGLQIDAIALEELGERVNGDMRMALNQLQYMNLQSQVVRYADMKSRLVSSAKDEDISPFNAVDKLMGYDGGRMRMDDRLDASMSDPDLVPLLIQENYLNFCPASVGQDATGTARMDLVAHAAASIADGDVVNVQIRRYRQWQHSQLAAFMSSIVPGSLMHGRREVLVQGERNYNRFSGWLGKNSSFGKKVRLLEDVHIHLLASRLCEPSREMLRLDYLFYIALCLTDPLRSKPKEIAVQDVVDFMEEYSLSQEDFDAILDLVRFQGYPGLLEGVQPSVKTALTKAYKQREHEWRIKSADLLPALPFAGQKKSFEETCVFESYSIIIL
eukprot:c28881_g2_i1 orf=668-3328(-)